ncbi:alpha/beta fold hydrolase [Chitinophaga sp. Cy-1792]|uniref:alpha/beta fold hydrolase n=1 Tax=Chitinophaga sp. Cy-1792 TaxID=2608339 RepID=UPI00141EC03B|nr:alpha/beta hydrolase [Chitinophaga sp. Cy-1792]NIG53707.1 alpha/beta hydrolase [Chitinophaga sp. Cy-1792]
MAKHLYMISGLGADDRVFGRLQFPEDYQLHYLPWITPLPDEPISSYAARMAAGITADGPVYLAGLSFGGMLSVEIAKLRPVAQTILISSIKHKTEKPAYFNWVLRLGLNKLPDFIVFQNRAPVVEYYMDIKSPEEKQLLKEYLAKKDYFYTRWAINTILNWQNEYVPENIIHIHGDKDHPFPIKYLQPTHVLKNAGHFMIWNRAEEINRILAVVLKK